MFVKLIIIGLILNKYKTKKRVSLKGNVRVENRDIFILNCHSSGRCQYENRISYFDNYSHDKKEKSGVESI